MKIVNPKYFSPISIESSSIETLVIENPKFLRNMIVELKLACDGNLEGDFVLSENNRIFSLSKYSDLITDIFCIDQKFRGMKGKLISDLVAEANESDKLPDLQKQLFAFGTDLAVSYNLPIEFKQAVTSLDILKLMDFKPDVSDLNLVDKIAEYLRFAKYLLGIKLFIVLNLKDFIDKNEFESLEEQLQDYDVCLLLIENHCHNDLDDPNHLMIIDHDLCRI